MQARTRSKSMSASIASRNGLMLSGFVWHGLKPGAMASVHALLHKPTITPRSPRSVGDRHPSRLARRQKVSSWLRPVQAEVTMTCSNETERTAEDRDRLAHNPEVAGSNPVPATKKVALTRPNSGRHQSAAASFCERL